MHKEKCSFDTNANETARARLSKVAQHTSSQDCGHMKWSDDKVRSWGESEEDITVFVESEVRWDSMIMNEAQWNEL